MKSEDFEFLADVSKEVASARGKYPTNSVLFAALVEEVGEVAKALQDETRERMYAELVQVAAMALRLAVEGDPAYTRSLKFESGKD